MDDYIENLELNLYEIDKRLRYASEFLVDYINQLPEGEQKESLKKIYVEYISESSIRARLTLPKNVKDEISERERKITEQLRVHIKNEYGTDKVH